MGEDQTGQDGSFDGNKYAVTVDQHGKDITDLNTKVSDLQDKISNPLRFAAVFREAYTESLTFRNAMDELIIELLVKSDPVKTRIFDLIKVADREYFKLQMKHYGGWLKMAGIFILAQFSLGLMGLLFEWLKTFHIAPGIAH